MSYSKQAIGIASCILLPEENQSQQKLPYNGTNSGDSSNITAQGDHRICQEYYGLSPQCPWD